MMFISTLQMRISMMKSIQRREISLYKWRWKRSEFQSNQVIIFCSFVFQWSVSWESMQSSFDFITLGNCVNSFPCCATFDASLILITLTQWCTIFTSPQTFTFAQGWIYRFWIIRFNLISFCMHLIYLSESCSLPTRWNNFSNLCSSWTKYPVKTCCY